MQHDELATLTLVHQQAKHLCAFVAGMWIDVYAAA